MPAKKRMKHISCGQAKNIKNIRFNASEKTAKKGAPRQRELRVEALDCIKTIKNIRFDASEKTAKKERPDNANCVSRHSTE